MRGVLVYLGVKRDTECASLRIFKSAAGREEKVGKSGGAGRALRRQFEGGG